MRTLFVRRSGSQLSQWLALGGGGWTVSDGRSELAQARMRLIRNEINVSIGGRKFTGRIPRTMGLSIPRAMEVVEDDTGRRIVEGKLVSGGATPAGSFVDQWEMAFGSGSTISWFYWPEDKKHPRRLGFYELDGTPVMTLGHDPSFSVPAGGGTFRILLALWGGAIASMDRYVMQMDEGAIDRVIPASDLPLLAFLGMFMERTAEGRYESVR